MLGLVQDFVSELDPTGDNFAYLPNWMFSTALAAYLQQKAPLGEPAKTGAAVDPIAEGAKAVMHYPTAVLAVLEKCDSLLLVSQACTLQSGYVQASTMRIHLCVLLVSSASPSDMRRLEEQGVHKDAEFQKLLKHSLFHVDEAEDSASLSHLEAIYAERQASLYKVRAQVSRALASSAEYIPLYIWQGGH